MEFWSEFLASSSGREFVAGGFGGIAGIFAGYPLDTLRIKLQNTKNGSAVTIFKHMVLREGTCSLYRGMAAPLATVTFQVFFFSFISFINFLYSVFLSFTRIKFHSDAHKLQWN